MRKILAAAVFAAIVASPLLAAPAQAQTPIKIMVGGIDKQIYLPAKLAVQLDLRLAGGDRAAGARGAGRGRVL
jgi:ABC-type nitrate/sulfonate/bicarbonate transport system substrate-binding protein